MYLHLSVMSFESPATLKNYVDSLGGKQTVDTLRNAPALTIMKWSRAPSVAPD